MSRQREGECLQVDYEFRAIGIWADPLTPASARKRSQFKAQYEQTLDLLFGEAEKLGARHLVLQVDLQPGDIRRDGLPRANALDGSNPGVVVSLDSRHGPLRYATDAFDDWRSNLRAIALSLEALRAVDRYGVSKRGEQYRGWGAIASASPGRGPFTTEDEARQWMRGSADVEGISRASWTTLDDLYKKLAVLMHPDMPAGSQDRWDRLDAAAKLLGVRGNRG
jgi:hypothetical protein